jgi:hypothetical protein
MLELGRYGEIKKAYMKMSEMMVSKGFPASHWAWHRCKARYKQAKKRWLQWQQMERSSTGPDHRGFMQAPRETFKALFAKDPSARWMLTEPLLRTDAYREVFEAVHSTGTWIRESGEEDDIPSDLQTNIEDPVPDSLDETPADHLGEGFTADPADRYPFASPSPVLRESSSLPSHSSISRRRGAVRGTRVALDSEGLTNAASALVNDSVERARTDIRAAARIVRTLDGLTQAQRFRASS